MRGREGKSFLSIEEVRRRLSRRSRKTHIRRCSSDAGAFGDLPDTSQVSLF